MQAFENFITAAKSGGGEDMNGNMAGLGIITNQSEYLLPGFQSVMPQPLQPVQTRAALAFLLSDKGNFFREFLLDEVLSRSTEAAFILRQFSLLLNITTYLIYLKCLSRCKGI